MRVINIRGFTKEACASEKINYKKSALKLIKAIQENDFRTLFYMDYWYQNDVASMIKSTPKYRLKEDLTKYFNEKKQTYDNKEYEFGSHENCLTSLIKLFPRSCNWKIIEVDPESAVIYVSIMYNSPEEAFEEKGFGIIKKTVAKIYLDKKSGYFYSVDFSKGETEYSTFFY